jgi:GTP-binding protein
MTGRGVGDLLSLMVDKLDLCPEREEEDKGSVVKLAVVGRPNVGKSTFINHILGKERLLVTEIPGTTRDAVDVHIQYQNHDFLLIDTAGLRRRSRVKNQVEYYSTLRSHQVIERCDVACVFTDAGQEFAHQDMRVVEEVIKARKGILVVVNKWDLIQKDEEKKKAWLHSLDYRLKGFSYVPVVRISALSGWHTTRVMDMVWRIACEREKRVPSPELNKLLTELGRRYQPPAPGGKRVRVLFGAQVGIKPPRIVLFSNFPHLVKESYRRFLENQIRDYFGFEGVPIVITFKKK